MTQQRGRKVVKSLYAIGDGVLPSQGAGMGLQRQRAAAEGLYRNAAIAYVEAWVMLHGFDLATGHSSGFGGMPTVLAHAPGLPDVSAVLRDLSGRAQEAAERAKACGF